MRRGTAMIAVVAAATAMLAGSATAQGADARAIATTMVMEICAPALPDFRSAIALGVDHGFSRLDQEPILLDDATEVTLTVVPASKTFLVISVPALCVVSLPAPGAAPYLPLAETLAGKLGPVTGTSGSAETLAGDGMTWTIDRGDTKIDLQLLEDHSPFGDAVIFALMDSVQ